MIDMIIHAQWKFGRSLVKRGSLMRMIKAFFRGLYVTEDVLARFSLAVIAVTVFAQVIARYVFSKSLPWAEELATITMVWAIYLGAAIDIRQRFHIRLLFIVKTLPRAIAVVVVFLGDALFLFFCAIMLWYGEIYLSLLWKREFVSPTFGIDLFYPHLIIAIAYVLMAVHTIGNYIIWFREGRPGLPGVDEIEGKTANLLGDSLS